MKSLGLMFIAIFSTSYGIEWRDFRAGTKSLPTSENAALAAGWEPVEKDNTIKITWYSQQDDPRLLLAFDVRAVLAGARISILQKDIDASYLGVYRRVNSTFDEGTILGHKVFYCTMLFTPEGVLKNGGRRMLPEDEVALDIYIKVGNEYQTLDRDGCDHAETSYTEQGCQAGYGLVSAKFGAKSKCGSIVPFYTIYDPDGQGNLLGVGWLSFSKFSAADFKTDTYYKTVSSNCFNKLFPQAPSCLRSYVAEKGLTGVDVWLSYKDGQRTSCPFTTGTWANSHCQEKISKRPSVFGTSSTKE